MKIVWVTPFAKRSAIGRVSEAVTNELAARNHEVLIVRSEHERSDVAPAQPSSLPIAWWHDLSPRDLAMQNDVIILNFGDNYDFHAGTLAFAESVLCLGIFFGAAGLPAREQCAQWRAYPPHRVWPAEILCKC